MTVQCRRGQVSGISCYTAGCRATACARAHAAYMERYRRDRNQLVDVRPSQDHVEALIRGGMTRKDIAAASGLSVEAISDIARALRPRIQRATARLVSRVQLRPTRTHVDATGARRRLQALAAVGWSANALGLHSRLSKATLEQIRSGVRPMIYRETDREVQALYDQHWDTRPPRGLSAKYSIARAERMGWPPPLAWDDDRIHDPKSQPQHDIRGARVAPVDEVAVQLRKPTTLEERRIVITELSEQGLSAVQIAEMVEATTRTVTRSRALTRSDAETQQSEAA